MPQELQFPMLEFAEALEEKLQSELAVRRSDFIALQNTVTELAQAQRRTEQRVEELAEAQRRTEESLNRLIGRVDRIETNLGRLIGDNLERKYGERAFSYLGQILRPVQSIRCRTCYLNWRPTSPRLRSMSFCRSISFCVGGPNMSTIAPRSGWQWKSPLSSTNGM